MSGFTNFVRRYRYELVAVADGLIIMMLELVGSRLVAPYLGSSIYVWTAIIGVILGALAVGNWYGGRLADQGASRHKLAVIILIAATILLAEMTMQAQVIQSIAGLPIDLRLSAFVVSLLVFAPPAALMGIVSPYLAKLRLTSLADAGQSVGRLYAAGTFGSIAGTFLAGYFLIGTVGSRNLGWSLVIALVLTTFLLQLRGWLWIRIGIIALTLLIGWTTTSGLITTAGYSLLYDGDSAYARYLVLGQTDETKDVRYLVNDNLGVQSGVDLRRPDEPVFGYTRRFAEAATALPAAPQRILMIGGGTFTVPSVLHQTYPDARIDVVEIDPALTGLAQRYFGYQASEQINIINQDGRYFLNRHAAKSQPAAARYDLVYIDAFSSLTPPFQLTTREAAGRLRDVLTPDGLLVVNLVATPAGPAAAFAQASTATYGLVFGDLKLYQADAGPDLTKRQNIIVLASGSAATLKQADGKLDWKPVPLPRAADPIILTDDRAPVEQLNAR